MLKDEEMYKLKEKIEYDFDAQKWVVPPFVVKNKEVAFPKIKNAATFAKNSLEERELVWTGNDQPICNESGSDEGGFSTGFDGHKKMSRNEQMNGQFYAAESPSGMQNFHSPFAGAAGGSKNGMRDKFRGSNQLNIGEYYGSAGRNQQSSQSGSKENRMGQSRSKLYADNGSSLNMASNDSDTNAQRTVQMKKTKYNSMERDPGTNTEISPIMMKKKANVHLEPMSHKKVPTMPPSSSDMGISHSESNPILNAQVVNNDRVKLEKLNHIPSVKSNLLASDAQSNGKIESTPGSINYADMPVGKKSVLAPMSNM